MCTFSSTLKRRVFLGHFQVKNKTSETRARGEMELYNNERDDVETP